MSAIAHVGELTLGQAMPAAFDATLAGAAGIELALPNVHAQLDALAAFSASVQLDFTQQLALLAQIQASIEAVMSMLPPPALPSLDVQASAMTALSAALQLSLGAIAGHLDALAAIRLQLGTAGVHVYAYDGSAAELGSTVSAATAGGLPGGAPSDQVRAVLLATNNPQTWDAMTIVFRVTP